MHDFKAHICHELANFSLEQTVDKLIMESILTKKLSSSFLAIYSTYIKNFFLILDNTEKARKSSLIKIKR